MMSNNTQHSVSSSIQNAVKTVEKSGLPLVQILLGGQAGIILVSLLCQQYNPFNSVPEEHPFLYILWALGTGVISLLMMTSCLNILKNARSGKVITWQEALKMAASRFWKVAGASVWYIFLMWLVFLLFGFIALAVVVIIYSIYPVASMLVGIIAAAAAIWLFVTTLLGAVFSIYAVATGEKDVFNALPYSYDLLKQNYWHLFKLGIIFGLIVALFSTMIGVIQLFIMPLYMVNTLLGIAATWLLSLPCTVINSVVALSLIYELYAGAKRTPKTQPAQN